MNATMIPSEWLEPGAVLPVTAETVATLLAAVKGCAFTQGRAAGLEEAAKICDAVNNHDNPMTARDCADAIRAISPTSSDAGKDDPILATWPAEIWLQAGDDPLLPYDEYGDVTWCRLPQGKNDVRYVLASSLEVIGKGEKG